MKKKKSWYIFRPFVLVSFSKKKNTERLEQKKMCRVSARRLSKFLGLVPDEFNLVKVKISDDLKQKLFLDFFFQYPLHFHFISFHLFYYLFYLIYFIQNGSF
jgi:hypothetical protein